MGVVHKLKPEIRDFIIEQKKSNPALSCRKLTALALDHYKIALSKSAINRIIKEVGLSAPVGRAPKQKKQRIVMPKLPVLLEDASSQKAEAKSVTAQPSENPKHFEDDKSQSSLPAGGQEIPVSQITLLPLPIDGSGPVKEAEEKAIRRQEEEIVRERERVLEEERRQEEIRAAREEAEQKIKAEAERLKALQIEEEAKRREEELQKARAEAARKAQEEELTRKEDAGAGDKEESGRQAMGGEAKEPAGKEASIFTFDRPLQLENTGIILLRAVDSVLGVSKLIAAEIKNRLPESGWDFEGITESIIYLPLLRGKIEKSLEDKLNGCLDAIENIKVIGLGIWRIMDFALREARCLKVSLSDGSTLYLDGQFYSVWSSPYMPYDFSSPLHDLKKRINKSFNTAAPLILFNAPGYDSPSQEFFNLLAGLEAKENSVNSLTIHGNKLEELETLPVSQAGKHLFIFGVWPWQFIECRKVRSIGDFRPYRLEGQGKDFFIADIEMELRNSGNAKQVILRGCALKTAITGKTRLVILSNLEPGAKRAEEIACLYLSHWPNLDEAFQDYSRKIELFTYTADSRRFFNAENINSGLTRDSSVKSLFENYLAVLDAYSRWHFLPAGYEDKDFAVTQERFYDLGARLDKGGENYVAEFVLPAEGYAFGNDLAYFCQRINEREAVLDGKRFLARP
ncbi:MAG: helix-turn-helix domain-containing protein [Candidatus Omnitrophota bacterium]